MQNRLAKHINVNGVSYVTNQHSVRRERKRERYEESKRNRRASNIALWLNVEGWRGFVKHNLLQSRYSLMPVIILVTDATYAHRGHGPPKPDRYTIVGTYR